VPDTNCVTVGCNITLTLNSWLLMNDLLCIRRRRICGSIPEGGKRCFSCTHFPDRLWAHPATIANEMKDIYFAESEASDHRSYHSPVPSAEIKNG
jgi:hypothetical protein